MNLLNDYLKSLTKRQKHDPIPGTIEGYLDQDCPLCGRTLAKMKPCCSNPNGHVACSDPLCGYREDQGVE